ncbi:hypothetical protein OHS33_15275 [Streptomyces sp. NBC_00536]|uniref:hypothetical protein n=1 Tax=Streptomyces sp. NBC_00536 TaxID=2975769 RepID=UPI002E81319A|nr:hypothetical protein [Streptomyces sp. NBC_00536]WUC79566.1 hypothetical protein OHS33_15275 [Streptomyces sp. NBC_00536]
MEPELTALAVSGATTLVNLMASEAWTQVSGRLARFFGRGGRDPEAAGAELEASREELRTALDGQDEDFAADIETEWRNRLRRVLAADPAAAAELRALMDEIAPQAPAGTTVNVKNTVRGGVHGGTVVQGHTIDGLTITQGGPPPPGRRP